MRISDWSSDVCSSDLVWTGQEPTWDSPINRGSHCVKGASVRELVHSDRRLKYPLKLVDGQWQRVSWDEAIGGIGDKLMEIREKSGPESVYWMGRSEEHTSELQSLMRISYAVFCLKKKI